MKAPTPAPIKERALADAVQRLAVGRAVRIHHSRQRLIDHLAAAPFAVRPVVAEFRHQRDDALRIGRLQRGAVGVEADHDNVGGLDEIVQRRPVVGSAAIENDRLFAEIEMKEQQRAEALCSGIERRQLADRRSLRRLDQHDLGAEIGHHPAGELARDAVAHVQNAQSVERG